MISYAQGLPNTPELPHVVTMEARAKLNGQRRDTFKAMVLLSAARFLVRFVPLSWWQNSLGIAQDQPEIFLSDAAKGEMEVAHYWARRVMRAARRLPGESKCLPQAVALQWLMSQNHQNSQLVIALHRQGGEQPDGLHAWVESAGTILIGHCDRDDYRQIAVFSLP